MNKIVDFLKKVVKSSWLNLIVLVITGLIGIFGQSVLEILFSQLDINAKLPYILFVITVCMYLAIVAIWRFTDNKIQSIKKYTSRLSDAIGQKVQIVPYAEGYVELQNQIREAKKEIRILSNYVFDWEKGTSVYDYVRLKTPERKASYELFKSKIEQESRIGSEFKFVKIIQMPSYGSLKAIEPYDPIYFDDCKFLSQMGKKQPDLTSLRISEFIFQNTFCIIDNSFLYIELDTEKPAEMEDAFTSYVMLLDDPKAEVIKDLVTLHRRIEANSKLVTELT